MRHKKFCAVLNIVNCSSRLPNNLRSTSLPFLIFLLHFSLRHKSLTYHTSHSPPPPSHLFVQWTCLPSGKLSQAVLLYSLMYAQRASQVLSVVKNCTGSLPELGRSPGERNSKLLQYARPENPMHRGAWPATVHSVTKSLTRLKWQHAPHAQRLEKRQSDKRYPMNTINQF